MISSIPNFTSLNLNEHLSFNLNKNPEWHHIYSDVGDVDSWYGIRIGKGFVGKDSDNPQIWLCTVDDSAVNAIAGNIYIGEPYTGIALSPALCVNVAAEFNQPISSIYSGGAPISVADSTVCPSLNADLLDGNHAADFSLATHTHSNVSYMYTILTASAASTVNITSTMLTSSIGLTSPTSVSAPVMYNLYEFNAGKCGANLSSGCNIYTKSGAGNFLDYLTVNLSGGNVTASIAIAFKLV